MSSSDREELRNLVEPAAVGDINRYMRRLVIEAPYIMARLHNPGGSILLMPTSNPDQVSYGTTIGNDAHLDLIDMGVVLQDDFSKGERELLYQWALGMTSQQAAEYNSVKATAIRKRRERVINKLENSVNEGRITIEPTGSGSDRDTAQRGEPEGSGDSGRETPEVDQQEGNPNFEI